MELDKVEGIAINTRALIMGLITVTVWSSGFSAISASLQGGYTPGHLVLTRFLIASGLFLLYALWPGVSFRLPKKKDLPSIIMLGLIGISTYHIGVSFGQQTVSAGVAGMLVGSSPIFTAIIAMIVLKERLSRFGWLGLLLGFFGIVLISLGSSTSNTTFSIGTLYILIAALATSIFFVYQKPLFHTYKPIEVTAYVTWAGTVPFFIFAPGLWDSVSHASLEANLSAIYVGIFPAAIAYVAWAIALSQGNASTVSSILYLEPVLAILIAWLWLHEWPSSLSLVGGLTALTGVLLVNVKKREAGLSSAQR